MKERKPRFKCPKCQDGFYSIRCRMKGKYVMVRYRRCKNCGHRAKTNERIVEKDLFTMLKK